MAKPATTKTSQPTATSRRAILAQRVKHYRELKQQAEAAPQPTASSGKTSKAPADEFLLSIPSGVDTQATRAYSEHFDMLQAIRADPDVAALVAEEDRIIAELEKRKADALLRTNALYAQVASRLSNGRYNVWEGKKDQASIDLAAVLRADLEAVKADVIGAGLDFPEEQRTTTGSAPKGKRTNVQALNYEAVRAICEAASFNRATKVPALPKGCDEAWVQANEDYVSAVAEIEANAAAGKS